MDLPPERVLTVRVSAQDVSRRELQQALISWMETTRSDGSARQIHVYEDLLTPGVFCLEAGWSTNADLERHLQSPGFGMLLGALTVLGQQLDLSIWQQAPEFGPDALSVICRRRKAV